MSETGQHFHIWYQTESRWIAMWFCLCQAFTGLANYNFWFITNACIVFEGVPMLSHTGAFREWTYWFWLTEIKRSSSLSVLAHFHREIFNSVSEFWKLPEGMLWSKLWCSCHDRLHIQFVKCAQTAGFTMFGLHI